MDGKTIRDKLVGSDDERAVSPVIGVILMVAITVILAAVIATLVMDFGDSVDQNANAGVTFEQDSSGEITATLNSMGNADEVKIRGGGSPCSDTEDTLSDVGDTWTNSSDDCPGQLTAVAVKGDTETTVQTYTAGE